MRNLAPFAAIVLLAGAVAQDSPKGNERSTDVRLLEVRKVNRPSLTDDQAYNIRIVLNDHAPLPSLAIWSLKITRSNMSQSTYDLTAEDAYQTEMEFEGDLTNATSVYLQGQTSKGENLISGYTLLNQEILSSRVAWVGQKYEQDASSVRVWPGLLNEVAVGTQICRKVDAPCYFLSASHPSNISRCVYTAYKVKLCNDFITQFQEMSARPEVSVSENNLLDVRVALTTNPAKIEAVVFDPQDSSRIFSPENYECLPVVVQGMQSCQQQLKDTNDLQQLKILLVALDKDDFVLESILSSYGGNVALKNNDTPVIVGAVFGVLFGVAIIAVVIVFFMKKNGRDKISSLGKSSSKYEATATSDPSTPGGDV